MSRFLTIKEQIVLLAFAGAICLGGVALLIHRSSNVKQDLRGSDVQPVSNLGQVVSSSAGPKLELGVVPVEAVPTAQDVRETEPVPDQPSARPSEKPEVIKVAIAGAVRKPGLYTLESDSRVHDLIALADGADPRADLSDINLAARLMDGSTLTIPMRGVRTMQDDTFILKRGQSAAALNPPEYTRSRWQAAAAEPQSAPLAPSSATAESRPKDGAGLISLNRATQEELESLPGIGPKLAEAIVLYRGNRPFQVIEDLLEVQGIGPKKFEAIRSLVTVN
ncbi:MAG: helix-hairpin-helix domain-containing protein [Candidatus Hydrogenedentes bacterium]|nr:helix-hairpin-helix domain-containing protein [Candidatus Hydrogenedentota bacterium]